MANRILNQLYVDLYGENFSYSNFSNRLKMQKGIYLLQEMGVPVGDYRFSWYKHGPYSQSLLDDMHSSQSSTEKFVLTSDTEIAISELREALIKPEGTKYSSDDWAECLGSLHYLKENIYSALSDSNDLLNELENRKLHLNDRKSNEIALARIEMLFN